MTTRLRTVGGMLLGIAVLAGEPQSRGTSQVSPVRMEVVRSGRVMPPSTLFRPGETVQIRAHATRSGRFYFFQRESESGSWKPVTPRSAAGGRIATIRLKASAKGNDVLVLLGFEELGEIDPAPIAAEQTPPPGETVSWRLPDMAVARTRLRVR